MIVGSSNPPVFPLLSNSFLTCGSSSFPSTNSIKNKMLDKAQQKV